MRQIVVLKEMLSNKEQTSEKSVLVNVQNLGEDHEVRTSTIAASFYRIRFF